MASSGRQRICPSAEELSRDVMRQVVCSVSGCGKVFSQLPALQMHLTLTHRIETGMKYGRRGGSQGDSQCHVDYCCPARKCVYSEGGSRCFKSMKLLKQHYMKVHAEKKFVCSRCNFGFGVERDYKRHTMTCGTIYKCTTCECPYATKEALQMHCLRKRHELPAELDSIKRPRKMSHPTEQWKSDHHPVHLSLSLGSGGTPSQNRPSGCCDQLLLRSNLMPLLPSSSDAPVSHRSELPVAAAAPPISPKHLCGGTQASCIAPKKLRRIMPKLPAIAANTAVSDSSAASADVAIAAGSPSGSVDTRVPAAPPQAKERCSRRSAASQASPADGAAVAGTRQRRGCRSSSAWRSRDRGSGGGKKAAAVWLPPGLSATPRRSQANACGIWTTEAVAPDVSTVTTPLNAQDEAVSVPPPVDRETQTLLDELSRLPPVDRETQTLLDELSRLSDDGDDGMDRSVSDFGRFLFDCRPSASTSVSSTQTDSPWWPSRLASAPSTAAATAAAPALSAAPLTVDAEQQQGSGCGAFVVTATTAAAVPLADQYAESETQTLLEELSAFTENMSTQTFHSFLFDSHSAMSFATQTPVLAVDDVDCSDGESGCSDGESGDDGSVGLAQCLPCVADIRTNNTEPTSLLAASHPALETADATARAGLDARLPSPCCPPLMREIARPLGVSPPHAIHVSHDAINVDSSVGASEVSEVVSSRTTTSHAGVDAVRDHGTTDRSALILRNVDATIQTNFDVCPTDSAACRQSGTQTVDFGDFLMISMETQTVDLSVQTWTQTEDDWALF